MAIQSHALDTDSQLLIYERRLTLSAPAVLPCGVCLIGFVLCLCVSYLPDSYLWLAAFEGALCMPGVKFGATMSGGELPLVPVATLPFAWRHRVSIGTGRPGVSIL